MDDPQDVELWDVELSIRARKGLFRLGCKTLRDVVEKDADQLLAVKNFGTVSLKEVVGVLQSYGLELKNCSTRNKRTRLLSKLSPNQLEKYQKFPASRDLREALQTAAIDIIGDSTITFWDLTPEWIVENIVADDLYNQSDLHWGNVVLLRKLLDRLGLTLRESI